MPGLNDIIGPYRIIRRIGGGSFGEVFLAERHQAMAASLCALKFPKDDPDDPINKVDFLREAHIWVQASGHTNVLPIHEAAVYDGQLVIVSEYAQDGSLVEWLRQHGGKAPSFEDAVDMVSGILRGLEHLHGRTPPIVHRDLKPGNVLLQDDTPRIADFGLSRVLTSSGSSAMAGTLAYLAPETFKGQRVPQTDLWAAGVILYRLLCGRLPFPQKDQALLVNAILSSSPDPLPSEVPEPLKTVVRCALDKDLEQRYKSAAGMRQALQQAWRQSESKASSEPVRKDEEPRKAAEKVKVDLFPEAEGNLQTVLPKTETVPLPQPRQSSSTGPAIAVALVLIMLIIAVIAISVSQSGKPNSFPAPIPSLSPTSSPALQRFEFNVVRTDADGEVTARSKARAGYFTEALGNGVQLQMVEIPGGEFQMGSTEAEAQTALAEARRYYEAAKPEWFIAETPRRRVTLPTFFMGRYEVTQAQWRAVMGSAPEGMNDLDSKFKGDNLPVVMVSWNEAVEFCRKLSGKADLTYRLPTEAEWEYACRAGTTTPFHFGPTITPELVNYNGNYPYGNASEGAYREKPTPVGSFGVANAFGLSDLHGNVWEWCEDVWHPNYNGAPDDGRAWTTGGDQNYRVLRGGSWGSDGWVCRAALRYIGGPGVRYDIVGFRVVVAARTP